MQNGARANPDAVQAPGVVELREDVPLKAGAGAGADGGCCAGGPRLILLAFAVLSAAITLALLTQIYYGDYEVVPHGSVSSSAGACSSAGTDALKRGGRALDAAAAAALCLAVLAPHRVSLDASGSLIYWEYRQSRTQPPTLFEWGGPEVAPAALTAEAPAPVTSHAAASPSGSETSEEAALHPAVVSPPPAAGPVSTMRAPRLVVALATLHARLGALPWASVLQPAIDLAKNGFNTSEGLATAESAAGAEAGRGALRTAPHLATYLEALQGNTSAELSAAWGGAGRVRAGAARPMAAGGWRAFAGGAGASAALAALAAALSPPPVDTDDASRRVLSSLQRAASGDWPPAGVSTGLAIVDRFDTYAALVAGLSKAFGSGPMTPEGWMRDEPTSSLDLAPAVITDEKICGTRYVVGAESSGSLAQAAAALVTGEGRPDAVERARVSVTRGGALALELARPALPAPRALPATPPTPAPSDPAATPAPPAPPAPAAAAPYAAVNVVRQRVDALLSYADSRGGGYASRF